MLLGAISDTHNQLDRTRRGVDLLVDAGAEAIVHCGDFTLPDIISLCAVRPLYFVLGNNDPVTELQHAALEAQATCLGWGGAITVAGKRIAATHGHRPGELLRLIAAEPDYLLSGHSHIAGDTRVGQVRRINPGALHRAARFTVAVIDLATDAVRFLEVPR